MKFINLLKTIYFGNLPITCIVLFFDRFHDDYDDDDKVIDIQPFGPPRFNCVYQKTLETSVFLQRERERVVSEGRDYKIEPIFMYIDLHNRLSIINNLPISVSGESREYDTCLCILPIQVLIS